MNKVMLLLLVFSCAVFAPAQVPYQRLVNADKEPGNWLTYSGNYAAHRFSSLKQITPENVANLKVKWVYQKEEKGGFETSPVVVDGVMYVTEPPTRVAGLDVRTGRKLWSWERKAARDTKLIGFGATNRGIAILDNTVYVGTLDCYIVALDARTGTVRWETKVQENKLGYSITGAPLAIDGKIIVGIAGGEAGVRGFLDAYDAKTGKLAWRCFTIPGPGEPGHDTWTGERWKMGGGTTWVTGSFDPELNLIYWGTGNPGPDWNGDVRPGDNLYTCSLLAIDATSGKIKWHFQYTPHDTHDWDASQIPVLFEANVNGQTRKVVAMANRNAFYYLLDRVTGEYLLAEPYAKQTWAKGIDAKGRPIVLPNTEPSLEGTLVWPALNGATNWWSPAYSPETKLFYAAVRERASYYYKGEVEFKPGTFYAGGGERPVDGDNKAWGAIRALEATTGKLKWEFRLHTPPWAGVLATAGGLVFGGSNEGNFYALDANTGQPLWEVQTGAPIAANPISFAIDGKQHVAIAAGQALFVFGLP
ncbi:MAG TPA: PQQ-dependent dehydrogenase, methanol/ethanol family [Blastocatellia bacterium]|nr:PQQ-dependent dehydrogenase, methanol/ethanol family [Blastocatellia bacterium]